MLIGTLIIIALLIMSIVVHEVSHGVVADALGDPTARLQGRLTLNPVSHIDPVGSIFVPLIMLLLPGNFIFGWARPVPYNPYNLRNQRWGEAIVAAAGPIVNIIIAILAGMLIRFGIGTLPGSLIEVASFVVLMNLILAIFNLIPIPPLDGSKILFAILPQTMQRLRIELERFSFVLVLIFVFFFWSAISPILLYFFKLITGVSFF